MASGEHSCTRRDLLGAALAVPLMTSLPLRGRGWGGVAVGLGDDPEAPRGSPSPPPPHPSPLKGEGAWRLAAVAVTEAEQAMDSAYAAQAGARSRAEEFALEEIYSDRLADLYDAVRALLRTPAPNVAALAVKVCLVVDHEVATLEGTEPCMAVVKADAMRLGALHSLPLRV